MSLRLFGHVSFLEISLWNARKQKVLQIGYEEMPSLSKIKEMHTKTQETVSDPIGKYLKYI